MVTGELDFQDTFGFSFDGDDIGQARDIYDPNMAFFIWIVFLVVIPILLSNMLVGNNHYFNFFLIIAMMFSF